MKSILMIGMGKFGHHLCEKLIDLGVDVMVVDWKESCVSDLIYKVTNVQIGDCTDPQVIKSLGVDNFDMVIVCIGTNFQSSLEVTSLVKEMGAKRVVSKANREVHARFLLKNGADEVIYPDRDIADKLAREYAADNVFDYIDLGDGDHSIYEITMPPSWVGHSMKELNIRQVYNISIIGLKTGKQMQILPEVDHIFEKNEHAMVLGARESVEKLMKQEKINW